MPSATTILNLKLRLLPANDYTRDIVSSTKNKSILHLTLKATKSIGHVIEHLKGKWGMPDVQHRLQLYVLDESSPGLMSCGHPISVAQVDRNILEALKHISPAILAAVSSGETCPLVPLMYTIQPDQSYFRGVVQNSASTTPNQNLLVQNKTEFNSSGQSAVDSILPPNISFDVNSLLAPRFDSRNILESSYKAIGPLELDWGCSKLILQSLPGPISEAPQIPTNKSVKQEVLLSNDDSVRKPAEFLSPASDSISECNAQPLLVGAFSIKNLKANSLHDLQKADNVSNTATPTSVINDNNSNSLQSALGTLGESSGPRQKTPSDLKSASSSKEVTISAFSPVTVTNNLSDLEKDVVHYPAVKYRRTASPSPVAAAAAAATATTATTSSEGPRSPKRVNSIESIKDSRDTSSHSRNDSINGVYLRSPTKAKVIGIPITSSQEGKAESDGVTTPSKQLKRVRFDSQVEVSTVLSISPIKDRKLASKVLKSVSQGYVNSSVSAPPQSFISKLSRVGRSRPNLRRILPTWVGPIGCTLTPFSSNS